MTAWLRQPAGQLSGLGALERRVLITLHGE